METFGAESLNEAVKADKTVVLDGIKSIAKSLGSTKVSEACLPAIKDHPGGFVSKVCHDTESIKGKSNSMSHITCWSGDRRTTYEGWLSDTDLLAIERT